MKYSYNWLQKHIEEELPNPSIIASALTMHAFEVEDILDQGFDTVFDIKVLPDRSHDALSHKGMALEISVLLGLTYIKREVSLPAPALGAFPLAVTDSRQSQRFMGILIKDIVVKDSPAWLKESLEIIGQRSINNIVDATNYVLYDQGKPMHAFDADKVVGTITTRFAVSGESLKTLDGKLVVLDESILVLADEDGPLDIAGIKGGTKAEVDRNTKNVVLVSSNFNSSLIRKTSQKVGIKTDAAKRFENGIASSLCAPALMGTAEIVLEIAGGGATEISEITDIYPKPEVHYKVGVSTAEINKVLGTSLTDDQVSGLLTQRGLEFVEKDVISEVVELAAGSIGKIYKRGASVLYDAPEVFDCSSLAAYLYKEAGLAIPRMTIDQYVFSYDRIGDPQLGDLLFINTGIQKTKTGSYYSQVLGKDILEVPVRYESVEWMPGTEVKEGVDHVGIYMGDGYVAHATSSVGSVVLEKIEESELFKNGYRCKFVVFGTEKRFVVKVPLERLDMRIKEDIIDELGKLIGTSSAKPSGTHDNNVKGIISKSIYYSTLIRNLLIEEGYSEVMTTSFSNQGDIAILNSVDPKKNHLRTSLVPGVISALEKGIYNCSFLGPEETIKVFEVGSVFTEGSEKLNIGVGIATKNKKQKKELKENIESTFVNIRDSLGLNSSFDSNGSDGVEVIEFNLSLDSLQEAINKDIFLENNYDSNIKYKTLSNYPFITRDIAVFIPDSESVETLESILRYKVGDLAVKIYQFDKFKKPDESRVSYGYRVVFQAFDRTLTDSEVEPSMQLVYEALKERGWEVR